MPYPTLASLPDAVRKLPRHGQEIFQSAYNSAFKQYGDEGRSAATAWAQVKKSYRQVGDQWVAREATMANKDLLQANYATIIQEAGKRNASPDLERIRKIVALCQELLSSEVEDEEKTQEALRESESVLSWLREQDAMKTEDGVQYPMQAFAYAPDKPSEWKLRLWEDPEKKVTRAQLGRAAAALSPGGFRGQRVQIPAADLAAVKRKIRAAYHSLDVANEDIPRWVMEALERTAVYEYIPVVEVDQKGVATVVVLRSGFNSSKERYYSPEAVARDYGIFEGVKMYADHPTKTEEKERPEGSIKNWVATLKNVHVDESGAIVGEAVIIEGWLKEKLAALKEQGLLSEMGISINAIGRGPKELQEVEGHKTKVVEELVIARSVDFVTEPGAGGVVQMYEADPNRDIDLIGLSLLRERRPDLIKEAEAVIREQVNQEVKRKVELEERITALEGQITTLTEERDAAKTELEESRKGQKMAETKSAVDKALSESELPEPAKARLSERFSSAESTDGLEDAIVAEKAYIDSIRESGKVKGMGPTMPDAAKSRQELVESAKAMHPDWNEQRINTFVDGR